MARVYRNIARPVLIFGLELVDMVVLIGFILFLFNVSDRLFLNGILIFLVYTTLRVLKKGRPEGYSTHLVRFLINPRFKHACLEKTRQGYLHGGAKK